jgi:hypothetical protein
MKTRHSILVLAFVIGFSLFARQKEPLFPDNLETKIPHVSEDPDVRIDYDIVYVRALRAGDDKHKRFYTDFSQPVTMEPGADLMLLHPDGSEELLVEGGIGSITDPVVSFDGKWVYYTKIHYLEKRSQWNPPSQGADIFKINLKTRRIVQLTDQTFTPNTGAANWSSDYRSREEGRTHYDYGVYNMGAYPLPGGRIIFTSNRDGFEPSRGYPAIALQLWVMDDSDKGIGRNLHKIGHLNIAGALHPVVLRDGRVMFSSLESQGIRSRISWGIWTIHPDGTNWDPLVSAFDPGGASNGFHFQTQLSDGSIVIEEYYNQNNSGFGAYIKLPENPPEGEPKFGPGWRRSPRNKPWRFGRHYNAKGKWYRMGFMPAGSVSMTPFVLNGEGPADPSVVGDKKSPRVGKFTHPSGAPDNQLLTVYSTGPVNHQYSYLPQLDGGLYLIKEGNVVNQPSDIRLIKNDPDYNESWPRAVVPYQRIYGIKEPFNPEHYSNDGTIDDDLPEGTPFGMIGAPSLYKRESYPDGDMDEDSVTASYPGGNDPWKGLDAFTSHGNGMPINWHNQGADSGLYDNSDIHALRIIAMDPTTDRQRGSDAGRKFFNHAEERLRILGEIPVRKFRNNGSQPMDPDGNPDTSFLARIPADTAFTFQSIDRNGMVLNSSQTWHQLRPGEVRNNCGGCHAHSQLPTNYDLTIASKDDYKPWDLVNTTPLLTDQKLDQSNTRWDTDNTTGLRTLRQGVHNVEYFRDIRPILDRSCTACHTKAWEKPAGNLVLNADAESIQYRHEGKFPGSYYRLALDEKAQFGHKPFGYDSWGYPNASRYIRKMQARRSLLVWKIFGRRLDGFHNDDHPSEPKPGAGVLRKKGEPVDEKQYRSKWDLDYLGKQMPPPAAVEGTWKGPDGKLVKVEPLSSEDRRTLVRWIDLGCPIDLDYDEKNPDRRGKGWMLDDNRPILTVTEPRAGHNLRLNRILIGMHDYYTGLDDNSFNVTASFPVNGIPAGKNLAHHFKTIAQGVRELRPRKPILSLRDARLTVSIKDHEGNTASIVRYFNVSTKVAASK